MQHQHKRATLFRMSPRIDYNFVTISLIANQCSASSPAPLSHNWICTLCARYPRERRYTLVHPHFLHETIYDKLLFSSVYTWSYCVNLFITPTVKVAENQPTQICSPHAPLEASLSLSRNASVVNWVSREYSPLPCSCRWLHTGRHVAFVVWLRAA